MTNREIAAKLKDLTLQERKITNEILNLINLALERRSYLELGFSSMFDWLVKGFGYSNASAYRRIEAARLLRVVPSVASKLESGEVNLTTLCQTQSAIKAQEKASGQRVSQESKAEAVARIENMSAPETERVLASLFPESATATLPPRARVIDENTTRLLLNFSNEMMADLKRVKEVLSHQFPEGRDADVLSYALQFLLEKKDPLRRTATSAAEATRVTKVSIRRQVIQSSQGACDYRDPLTGQVCGSRHQVQIDHIQPRALGGDDSPANLRVLCRRHNFFAAEKSFGSRHMRKFREASV